MCEDVPRQKIALRHLRGKLLRLLVDGSLLVPLTELLVFYPPRLRLLVLCCRVVTTLALGTFERYDISHWDSPVGNADTVATIATHCLGLKGAGDGTRTRDQQLGRL